MLQLPEYAGVEEWYLPRFMMTEGERRAIEATDALAEAFGSFGGRRAHVAIQPCSMARFVTPLHRPPERLYYLAAWQVWYPCFGNTVIEALSLMVSHLFATNLLGAIAAPAWSPRMVAAGLTITPRDELETWCLP